MKRNYLALLMAAVMLLSCIFMIAPTAYAETPADTSPDTPADEPAKDPTENPDFVTSLLIKIIRFFKWLIPLVEAYVEAYI